MENLYDLRKKNNLVHILPKERNMYVISKEVLKKVAIAVNLYYEDGAKEYMVYLNEVPEEIDIYIYSSNPAVFDCVEKLKKRRICTVKKDNRGRDVSALLVDFRKNVWNYRYICFLHDKKEKQTYYKKDMDIWKKNLWGNMIASQNYIYNVVGTFEMQEQIGMLVPPEPVGEFIDSWYGTTWADNYENVVCLAKELELLCNIDKEKQPITLGTVFWARTKSLDKLFSREWKYEDFPEEPFPLDGSISHAIERILAYVAQDAGYEVATLMTDSYAAWNLLFVQECMKRMFPLMNEKLKIHSVYQLNNLEKQESTIKKFLEENPQVYIYGAGKYGVSMFKYITAWGYMPSGFIVSEGKRECTEIQGIPVFELGEIGSIKEIGIIVAVNYGLQEKIITILQKAGLYNYINGFWFED